MINAWLNSRSEFGRKDSRWKETREQINKAPSVVGEAVGLNSCHVSDPGAVLGICGSEFWMSP